MSSSLKNKILIVGAFPPPVTGMATTNKAVYDQLKKMGVDLYMIDISALTLNRSVLARASRIPRILRGMIRVLFMPGLANATLYISISGNLGQLYEIAFVAIARMRRMRIFARHCSFAYLDEPTRISHLLISLMGVSAVHITQSNGMANRLRAVYRTQRVLPISNSVLYPQGKITSELFRHELQTIGFFSNLSAEKGVFDFLDLMATIETEGLPLRGKIAGPFQDAGTENAVRERLEKLRTVEYVGAVYGRDKESFLSSIDVLAFPTRYKNETEAKVNHEAMSRGIPVIAYGRGCIPEIIGPGCGKVIDPADPFVPEAVAQIKAWLNDPEVFEKASRAAAQRFAETYAQNEQRWKALLSDLAGNIDPDVRPYVTKAGE